MSESPRHEPVRYAVVGLGHIAQVAVLPAFDQAEGTELAALVSGDEEKRRALARRHGVARTASYEQYDELLAGGELDAVFIALPNHLHADYAVRAARAGVHVLVEKPMAVTAEECQVMIQAAEEHDVRLMVAYRLHFEEANMEAVALARGGELGELRLFTSTFSQLVKPGDIRLGPLEQGGGPVYDLGIYCINAARYLFADEPVEVLAQSARGSDPRFARCDETTSAVLRFPGERLAAFTTSFGAREIGSYRLAGTRGELHMDPAYEYAVPLAFEATVDGEPRRHQLPKRDQFAPQLIYFARCVREGRHPEPDGWEGLADVRVIEAVHRSAAEGRVVPLEPLEIHRRPGPRQVITRPGIEAPEEVRASGPKEP